ncbi:MAG: DUF2089 domain-containing protein [Chloroflexi bacterium]|nr:DUF2089 domain-containing protein [Chloroflexota bacterium]
MYPVRGSCPVCGNEMVVQRLVCRNCGSSLEGQFTLDRFARLNSEQLQFLESFIRNEGKLSRMEGELGLSYPTLRTRLTDLIRGMGYEVREEPAPSLSPEQRREILEKVAQGELTAQEAALQLQSGTV